MKVLYEGVDIYPDISVNQCFHEMYAEGHTDELIIRFNDTRGRWDEWGPKEGDAIQVTEGNADTGKMFIKSVSPENGVYTLRAYSMPIEAMNTSSKSWEQVRLLQLCDEIAGRLGLALDTYGLTDHNYQFVSKANQTDLCFLQQRCRMEGAAFLIYDGRLVVYDEKTIEAEEPAKTVTIGSDTEFEMSDNTSRAAGTAVVTNGTISGQFSAGNGTQVIRQAVPAYMENEAEAARYAAGALRNANKGLFTVIVWQPKIVANIAAGSVVAVTGETVMSWAGPMFVYRVRHDYEQRQSKIFMRRPLEGY